MPARPLPLLWVDGRLCGEARAPSIAPGVFETVRAAAGRPCFLREHLARLERGARALELPWPPPWDPAAVLAELAREVELPEAALRLAWTPPELSVAVREVTPVPDRAVALVARPGEVVPPRPPGVKTTARASYDELRAAALRRGAWEALVRDGTGRLVEGTITSLFAAVDGVLATPPLDSGALPGIVRGAVLTEFEREPLRDGSGRTWRVVERSLELGDLLRAEEVLLTNSLVRVVALGGLEGPEGGRDDLPGTRGGVHRALRARVELLERRAAGSCRPDRC